MPPRAPRLALTFTLTLAGAGAADPKAARCRGARWSARGCTELAHDVAQRVRHRQGERGLRVRLRGDQRAPLLTGRALFVSDDAIRMHSGRNQGHQEAINEAHLIMGRAIVEEDPLSLQPSDHMSFGVWHRAAGKHDHMHRDPQPQQRAQDGA
jgi:hypothetical protein